MVTFTINIPQMLAYIPYMDPMGNQLLSWFSWFNWFSSVGQLWSFWKIYHDISVVRWAYKPTNITGGHHFVATLWWQCRVCWGCCLGWLNFGQGQPMSLPENKDPENECFCRFKALSLIFELFSHDVKLSDFAATKEMTVSLTWTSSQGCKLFHFQKIYIYIYTLW